MPFDTWMGCVGPRSAELRLLRARQGEPGTEECGRPRPRGRRTECTPNQPLSTLSGAPWSLVTGSQEGPLAVDLWLALLCQL